MPIRPKMLTLLCAAAFVPGLCVYAQQPAPAAKEETRTKTEQKEAPKKEATKTDVEKIIDEGTNRSQVMKTLGYLSDVIGPRLTGSPGLKRANEWTCDQLKGYGLENAHLEPWGPFGKGWTLKGFSAEVVEPLCIPLIAYPKAWSPGTHGRVVAEVVYLDANTDSDFARFKGQLRGKIVMTSPVLPVAAHFEPLGVRQTDSQLLDLANSPMPGEGPRRPRRGQPQAPAAPAGPGQAAASNNPAAAANNPANMLAQMVVTRRKLAFALEEGALAVLDPSRMGDGGTIFVAQASVPTPPPAAGGGQASTPVASATQPANGQAGAGQGGNGGGGGDGQAGGGGQGGGGGRGAGPRGPSAWEKDAPKNLPQIAVSKEHYNRMIRMIEAGQTLKVAIDLAVEFQDMDPMAYNTVAEIPGTDLKDELVMLGGHLDSWHAGTGATDNAAGCAVGMEAVRIIKASGLKPRRTIRIALWSGEEQGLYGSKAYVKEHFGEAPSGGGGGGMFGGGLVVGSPKEGTKKPAYDKFSAYFNLDNGTGKVRGVYLQGNEAVRLIFRQWLAPFRDMARRPLACRTPAAPTTSRSTPSACLGSSSSRMRSSTTPGPTTRTRTSSTAPRATT